MPENSSNTELLRSLGRLVRGLSALFWGLPVALIVCFQTAKTDTLRNFDVFPAIATTGWLLFGLWQLGHFQKQERIWHSALDRAKLLAMINLGLSPFLYWWNQMPYQPFFAAMVGVLGISGLLFLSTLNLVLYRLSAMLPDEGLRHETRYFTTLNRYLVLAILILGILFFLLQRYPLIVPNQLMILLVLAERSWLFMTLLVLLPLAMTMALIWKTKEVILESVFGQGH